METASKIIVRDMTKADIPAVCEIENQAFSLPWSAKAFEESLELPHAMFLVAQCDDVICGYCGMYQVFQEGDITNVAVLPEYRQTGVGSRLLQGLISKALEREICDITLEVRESNEPAIRLYTKFGFENAGIRKGFYEKPKENAIVMWKRDIQN